MDIVIVESPAKAKTINKYLGGDSQVFASFGHVRDLSDKDGSVDPDDNFAMSWEVHGDATKRLSDIARAVKSADRLILATDPDREGEAISWHVLEVLRQKKALADKPVFRVVFNAITRDAVLDAMAHPREIDTHLVDAYLARRALDYLVGFTLSPVLWRKLPGARSAGRVQSVSLRLICARELEIEKFTSREYWSVKAQFTDENNASLPTRLVKLDGKMLDKFSLPSAQAANNAVAVIEASNFAVTKIEKKPEQRRPAPPFTTSTLQQEAARKLGFSASRTMQLAQKLYEGISIDGETVGLITYMRTDGLDIAPEAIANLRHVIVDRFGQDYLPKAPRIYKKTAANAQEAHEAVRPTSAMRSPADMEARLENDMARLYKLIWDRAMASQMNNAQMERTTISVESTDGATGLRASGIVMRFPGFTALYNEDQDDREAQDGSDVQDDKDTHLPALVEGAALDARAITPEQHFTMPPPRYTEASLVKKMEELGIGRPSTYASTLSVLRDRDYVSMDKKRFVPQDKGRLVICFLESYFDRYVEYDFTSALEADLDKVARGDLNYIDVLMRFWGDFKHTVDAALKLRNMDVLNRLNEVMGAHVFGTDDDGNILKACPLCDEGELSLKTGRFGAFVGCTRYPECRFTRPFTSSNEEATASSDRILGQTLEDAQDIVVKSGRFGPYIECAPMSNEDKPRRVSLPKPMTPETITLEDARKLLSLPREVGAHPESGEMINAALGRYGPYLQAGKQSASLESVDDLFTIGLNHAVTLLAEQKNKRGRGGTNSANSVILDLGDHPEGGVMKVLTGRYGPYVKHEKINATIPKGEDPATITQARAIELIAARKAKGKTKKRGDKRK